MLSSYYISGPNPGEFLLISGANFIRSSYNKGWAPVGQKYIHLLINVYYSCIFVYNYYIQTGHFIMKLFNLKLTEAELETVAAALEEYKNYDDEGMDSEDLIGGTPVSERVEAIDDKITECFEIGY